MSTRIGFMWTRQSPGPGAAQRVQRAADRADRGDLCAGALAVGAGHRADLLAGAAVLGAGRGRSELVDLPAGWAGLPGAAAGRTPAALRAGDVSLTGRTPWWGLGRLRL